MVVCTTALLVFFKGFIVYFSMCFLFLLIRNGSYYTMYSSFCQHFFEIFLKTFSSLYLFLLPFDFSSSSSSFLGQNKRLVILVFFIIVISFLTNSLIYISFLLCCFFLCSLLYYLLYYFKLNMSTTFLYFLYGNFYHIKKGVKHRFTLFLVLLLRESKSLLLTPLILLRCHNSLAVFGCISYPNCILLCICLPLLGKPLPYKQSLLSC